MVGEDLYMPLQQERVAVVVVTYNSADVLPDLLESLPPGLEGTAWRLVVVDNGSIDDSIRVVQEAAPTSTVVQMGRNAGYAAGVNAGVAEATEATAVLVLNADVRLTPGCVTELLRGLRTRGTGIAVPRLTDAHGALIYSMRREPTLARELVETVLPHRLLGRFRDAGVMVTDSRTYATETTTDWAEGSTQLISRECLDVCGRWDESFFLFSEETEFNLRARDLGYMTRYVPTAHATHLEGGSAADPDKWALLCRNKVSLYRRRHGRARSTAFHACEILREATRAATGRATSRAALRVLVSPRRLRAPAGPEWLRGTTTSPVPLNGALR
jgi:N-acetylglucosaminyl-diphospho-decaprenol L-rhamnosyltransferase